MDEEINKNKKSIEVERGVEYMTYQREVGILTDFWKKTAERSKNEEITRKSQKLTKNQEICANFEPQTHFQALQYQFSVISIFEVCISI